MASRRGAMLGWRSAGRGRRPIIWPTSGVPGRWRRWRNERPDRETDISPLAVQPLSRGTRRPAILLAMAQPGCPGTRASLVGDGAEGAGMDTHGIVTMARQQNIRLTRFLYCDNAGLIRGKATSTASLEGRLE